VLGCGTVCRQVTDQVAERDGRVLVITNDESVVETLRDESVPSRSADPADPATIANVDTPDVIFVGSDRTDVNRAALEAARASGFPMP